MGMEKIIICKENVLAKIGDENMISSNVANSFTDCVDIFDRKNVYLIERSNYFHTRKYLFLQNYII